MDSSPVRLLRIAAIFITAWAVLYVRFSSGAVKVTEADPYVHWALLAIALMFGAGCAALEMTHSGSVVRRDFLWALSGALASFSICRFVGLA